MIPISLEFLVREADILGLRLSSQQEAQFETYMEMLLDYNERVNLTAISSREEVVRKHFLDSLSVVRAVALTGRAIDVGTGAGFPGLPLAIVSPDLEVTLVDSLDKRVRFLREVITALGLQARVQAVHARAEDAGQMKTHREQYDISLSRAVARLNLLAEYCLPFVRVGGHFVAMKGPAAVDEIEEAKSAVVLLGGGSPCSVSWKLPGEGEERLLITIPKIKVTPAQYPRKAGTPAKKPLL